MRRFVGRNVVVTGGSSGIGRATALAFASEGARVLAVGRDEERLAAVRAAATDRLVSTLVADLRRVDEARRVVAAAIARFERLQVLVNCAGVAFGEPVLEITESAWDETMTTNLGSAFFASQEAARHMVAAGGGCIVNVASIDALVADAPYGQYAISKAGVAMMTRVFAHELGHLGVRCNAVAPGVTLTPMTTGPFEGMSEEENRRMFLGNLARIPQRRAGTPEEQAAVILFLASDDASFVNGETVVCDGGQLAGYWYSVADAPPVPDAETAGVDTGCSPSGGTP